MKLLILFIVLNVANVIIQTIKSLVTVKCGKTAAAITNAVAFGLYTIVTVYMMCELPLFLKAGVVALCNLIGVWVVKFFEEKAGKNKLWIVEATVTPLKVADVVLALDDKNISYICFRTSNECTVFNIFCPTQKESMIVQKILYKNDAKYLVTGK